MKGSERRGWLAEKKIKWKLWPRIYCFRKWTESFSFASQYGWEGGHRQWHLGMTCLATAGLLKYYSRRTPTEYIGKFAMTNSQQNLFFVLFLLLFWSRSRLISFRSFGLLAFLGSIIKKEKRGKRNLTFLPLTSELFSGQVKCVFGAQGGRSDDVGGCFVFTEK